MNNTNNKTKQVPRFEIAISKDRLNELPAEKYSGEIVVIDDLPMADIAAEELSHAAIIGFDTETKPAFQKGQINKVALLQLATENKCFLIRLSKIGLPDNIKALLENPKLKKVGLSIKDDFHSLAKISDLHPDGFLDLQSFVKEFMISDCSLTKIHAIIFGKRISKSQQLTNWEAGTLTEKQKEYAALDALACVNIYNHLISGNFIPEESPYIIHPCQQEEN